MWVVTVYDNHEVHIFEYETEAEAIEAAKNYENAVISYTK